MAKEGLSGYEKAAILLLSLGEDVASAVFSKLDEGEIEKLGNVMTTLKSISPEKRAAVMTEFSKKAVEAGFIPDGDAFIKNTLIKALGAEKGEELAKNIASSKPGALAELKHLHPKLLAQFIRNEHPQTVAMILAHLEPIKSAEVLSHFPIDVKKDIIIRIATIENISQEAIEEVEQVISREMKSLGSQYGEKMGGAHAAAEVLNMMDKTSEGLVLEKMEEENPDLATSIRELMFIFEDITGVDDRGIQTILKEINNEQLMLALKTASDELKDMIFRNMSERAAEMLKEDMEAMGPVKLSEVEAAQMVIINIVRKLEEQGKIVIGGKGGEDLVV